MYRNGKHMHCLTWIVDEDNQDMLKDELVEKDLYLCIDTEETKTGKDWIDYFKEHPVKDDYFKLVEVSHPYDISEPNQELVEACETVLAGDYEGDDVDFDNKQLNVEFNITYGRGYFARTIWYHLSVDIVIDSWEYDEITGTNLPGEWHIKEDATVCVKKIR